MEHLKKEFKYSEISDETISEIYNFLNNTTNDFVVHALSDDLLLISENVMEDYAVQTLESDLYFLGMHSHHMIANALDCNPDLIKALQDSEKFDLIGQEVKDKKATAFIVEDLNMEHNYTNVFTQFSEETYFTFHYKGFFLLHN